MLTFIISIQTLRAVQNSRSWWFLIAVLMAYDAQFSFIYDFTLFSFQRLPAVSLFLMVCWAKRARCATAWPRPSVSRRITHTCTSLTNPGEKERLVAVYKFQLLLIQYRLKYKFYIIFIYLHKLDIRYVVKCIWPKILLQNGIKIEIKLVLSDAAFWAWLWVTYFEALFSLY